MQAPEKVDIDRTKISIENDEEWVKFAHLLSYFSDS